MTAFITCSSCILSVVQEKLLHAWNPRVQTVSEIKGPVCSMWLHQARILQIANNNPCTHATTFSLCRIACAGSESANKCLRIPRASIWFVCSGLLMILVFR